MLQTGDAFVHVLRGLLMSSVPHWQQWQGSYVQFVDPVGLGALVAGRLVPLDKIPGVRPLSIFYFSPIICLLLFLLHVRITWVFPIIIKFHRS